MHIICLINYIYIYNYIYIIIYIYIYIDIFNMCVCAHVALAALIRWFHWALRRCHKRC